MTNAADSEIAAILGKIPSGCAVLTAAHDNQASGMLVSWVQQASFEPLLLTVAIKTARPMLDLMDASGRFVVNLLGQDPTKMFQHFGKGFAPGEPAFEGLACRESSYGVILEQTLGYLECVVESRIQAGDHWLYVGKPVSGASLGTMEPYVHVRKSARNY